MTLAVGVINIFWLLPLAWWASREAGHGWWIAGIAYLPLVVLALRLGAGRSSVVEE